MDETLHTMYNAWQLSSVKHLQLLFKPFKRVTSTTDGGRESMANSSGTTNSLISFGKSTPPQNNQLNILKCNRKPYVDDLAGELTSLNCWVNSLCDIEIGPSLMKSEKRLISANV